MKARIVAKLRGSVPAPDVEAAARATFPADVAAALFPRALTPAAVLVPLIEREEGLAVLLTRRTEHLRDHPGQISFPGGRLDPGDVDALAAALREAREELGIDPALVQVAGYLPVHAVITGFAITPVVGFVPASLELHPDPMEVAEAFEVPLAFFADAGNRVLAKRRVGAIEIDVGEYRFAERRIWGATAQILDSLTHALLNQ